MSKASNGRIWLFRGLVVIAAGFLVVTWFMPWWNADCAELSKNAVVVRPWGLEDDLGFYSFMLDDARMPGWFAPFAFTYLGVVLVMLLLSLFAKDGVFKFWKFKLTLPSVLIGLAGISYIGVAVIAIVVMVMRMGDFFGGIPLIGKITIPLEAGTMEGHITTSLETGYFLTYLVGILLIVLALFRDRILGRQLTSS